MEHRSKNFGTDKVAQVSPGEDRDRPLLPLTVPVERDRHGTEPSADDSADETAESLVQGSGGSENSRQRGAVNAANKENGEDGEDGDVGAAEKRVRNMGEERRAEEDQEDMKNRCCEEGEDQ